ncbi:MAG: hypothetical protein U0570_07705 [Phycisphaerales bacterium]
MTLSPALRFLIAALSLLTGLSAVGTLGAAFLAAPHPPWTLVGFEVLTLLAAGFGFAVSRGRFSDGQGLAIACVAGTVLAASILGYLGATGQIGDWKLHTWLLARGLLAFALGLVAAWAVLRRTPGAGPLALRGAVYTGAAVTFGVLLTAFDGELSMSIKPGRAGLGGIVTLGALITTLGCVLYGMKTLLTPAKADDTVPKWMRLLGQWSLPITAGLLLLVSKGHLTTSLAGIADALRIALLSVLAMVLTGLLCAGVHIIVQAFDSCTTRDENPVMPTQGATSS